MSLTVTAETKAPDVALRLRGVSVVSTTGDPILHDIDWELEAGQVATIIGASGSGKSHLLRVLNRLTEIASGELTILGKPIADWHVGALRQAVGWVPQRPMLHAGKVSDILDVPQRLGLITKAEHGQRMALATATVQLPTALLKRSLSMLSGGERHRVAIARALLLEPKVLLLDEPSGALDGHSAAELLRQLLNWAKERAATLVMVSHRIEDVLNIGGMLVVLDAGRIVRIGGTRELLADPTGYDVRKLLTGRGQDEEAH